MSQRSSAWDLGINVGPPLLGLTLVAVAASARQVPGRVFATACALLVVGFLLFVGAKVSVFRQGPWVSFGARQMRPRYRIAYGVGYALMLGGAVAAATLIIVWR